MSFWASFPFWSWKPLGADALAAPPVTLAPEFELMEALVPVGTLAPLCAPEAFVTETVGILAAVPVAHPEAATVTVTVD